MNMFDPGVAEVGIHTQPLTESTEYRLVESRGDWLLTRLSRGEESRVE